MNPVLTIVQKFLRSFRMDEQGNMVIMVNQTNENEQTTNEQTTTGLQTYTETTKSNYKLQNSDIASMKLIPRTIEVGTNY